jgi:hypothetical protein
MQDESCAPAFGERGFLNLMAVPFQVSAMSTAVEEIWAILREVSQAQKDSERELKERFRETERLIEEASENHREVAFLLKETNRELKEHVRKMDRILERLTNMDKEAEWTSKKTRERIDGQGDFVEDAVRPAAVRLFRERGMDVYEVRQNVYAQRGEESVKIDALIANDQEIVAIKCEIELALADVEEHAERLGKLKKLLPAYANMATAQFRDGAEGAAAFLE